jgi:2-polyprenyl-3-methyl-5-hydroxy-6-metoxy-1,4-benzoquinol methylase
VTTNRDASIDDPSARGYDRSADVYTTFVARREENGPDGDPFRILPSLLDVLGDVAGQHVLDAGCGEGYLARVLAARGARVTGIDLAPSLIEIARSKDPRGEIGYRLADLSQPLLSFSSHFDAIASYLVLNDVRDYRGFARTLGDVLAPGGRLVLAFNNPYGLVIRPYLSDYFDSDSVHEYGGPGALGITGAFGTRGIKVHFYHRTLAEYLDAFLAAGLTLTKLVDLPAVYPSGQPGRLLPEGYRFPRFMLLAFTRP